MKLAFENIIADPNTRQETKAKVKDLLKKLNSYRFVFCNMFLGHSRNCHTNFKDFEAERLLPFEVQPLVSEN